MNEKRTVFLLIITIFITSTEPFAQQAGKSGNNEPVGAEKAAAEALLETKIGGADVDLLLTGTWDISLTGSYGFGYNREEEALASMIFPEFTQGIRFQQTPDITIALWLLNRFFFEASFAEDADSNTFLVGYVGMQDEFLQSVLIGNTEIEMDSYGLFETSRMPPHSLGAVARFESDVSKHETMVRFDPSEKQEKSYVGEYELQEQVVGLGDYITNRFFLLPDAEVDGLKVYIEDKEGAFSDQTGTRYYREMTPDDGVASSNKGLLTFSDAVTGRIAVFYTKNGKEVGTPELGEDFLCGITGGELDPRQEPLDFSWEVTDYLDQDMQKRQILIDGKTSLLLNEPGIFSPFQLANSYPITIDIPDETWRLAAKLASKGDRTGDKEDVTIEIVEEEARIRILNVDTDIRNPVNRYPFASVFPFLYGPDRELRSGYVDKELHIQALKESEGYFLETDVIQGSLSITINGRKEDAYQYDPDTGEIIFYTYIHPEDEIVIRYRTASQSRGGNITAVIGNHFTLSPTISLEAGAGLNWNIISNSYSDEADENPGSILSTFGAAYSSDRLNARIDTGLSFTTPNTTGTYRILGMEKDGLTLSMSGRKMYPSSIPEETIDPASLYTVSRQNRGILLYKDYNSYSILGTSQLMPYTWSPPAAQQYPYSTGSKPGPYPALSDSTEITDKIMVMEYQLSAAKTWVGAQIPFDAEIDAADLSGITALRFFIKAPETDTAPKLFLHIGKLSEDLDGDGILDEESSEYDTGFPFNDPSQGAVLRIGGGADNTGNMIIDSEDFDNDGLLDEENDELIIKKEIAFPGQTWEQVQLVFTERERNLLQTANGVRIILYSDNQQAVTGKLMVSGINLTGTSFKTEAVPSGTITARETAENGALYPPAIELSAAYPEVATVLHPEGEAQKVLEIDWDEIPEGGKWKCTGYTNTVPISDYQNITFYLRYGGNTDTESAVFQIAFTGNDAKGIYCSLPVSGEEEWRKISIDLEKRSVSADGTPIEGATVVVEETEGTLSEFHLTMENSKTGTLYIDEVTLDRPFVHASGAVEGSLEYMLPGEILSFNSFPVLSDLFFRQSAGIIGKHFTSGFSESSPASVINSKTELEVTLAFLQLNTDIGIVYGYDDDNLTLSGGHRILLPSFSFPITVADAYSERNDGVSRTFSRENAFNVSIPRLASLKGTVKASLYPPVLHQQWLGVINSSWTIPWTLILNTSFSEASTDFTFPEISYFENWIRQYSLIVPVLSDPSPDRSAGFEIDTKLSLVPVGFTCNAAIDYSVSGTKNRTQENSGEILFSIPLTFHSQSPFQWSITPEYSRMFINSITAETGKSYGYDLALFGRTFSSQSYIYTFFPGQDIFSKKTRELFLKTAADVPRAFFSPSISVTIRRQSGSYLRDLFIPSQANITLTRFLEKEENFIEDTADLTFSFRNSAVNLFGAFGVYPLFIFYQSEEIGLSIELTLSFEDNFVFTGSELILQNYFTFEGKGKNKLVIDNRFGYTWAEKNRISEDISIAYTWQAFPGWTMTLPFLQERQKNPPYFLHTESIEFGIDSEEGVNPMPAYLSIIKHESGLYFPEIGNISAFISLGITGDSNEPVIFGIRGGIEGKISF